MAQTATYLNFKRETEEAFNFYKSVFGTEFLSDIVRFSDVPTSDEYPGPSESDRNLVMNVALPVTGGHILMGTDAPESMGFNVDQGNNVSICLMPDTREEADRLFAGLSEGGSVQMPLTEMFWGDYFGQFFDKYGISWMIDVPQSR